MIDIYKNPATDAVALAYDSGDSGDSGVWIVNPGASLITTDPVPDDWTLIWSGNQPSEDDALRRLNQIKERVARLDYGNAPDDLAWLTAEVQRLRSLIAFHELRALTLISTGDDNDHACESHCTLAHYEEGIESPWRQRMAQTNAVTNAVSGPVTGSVTQFGHIQGGVHL